MSASCECCSDLHLPQFGFSSEVGFRRLAERNLFLFRVHTPKPAHGQSLLDDAFVAPRFDTRYSDSDERILHEPPVPTYAEVARHLDWTTRLSSMYVSASFSFMWAIWEALRRYHFGVKHDVEIAVIDATASIIAQRAATAVEVLNSASPSVRHPDHWKWYHHAEESQAVLIYGAVPQFAVLASIPLAKILDALPSYVLRPFPSLKPTPTLLERVAWFYPRPPSKPSFHTFCTVQTAFFRALSPAAQNADATRGAVRLAMAFLGGWVAWMVQLLPMPDAGNSKNTGTQNVFSRRASRTVFELAQTIARWPYESRDHDMWRAVVQELQVIVGEEIKRVEIGGPQKLLQQQQQAVKTEDHVEDAASSSSDWAEVKTPRPTRMPLPITLPSPIQRASSHLPTPPPTPPPSLVSPAGSSTSITHHVPDCLDIDAPLLARVNEALDKGHQAFEGSPTRLDVQTPLTPPDSPVLSPIMPGGTRPSPIEPLNLSDLHTHRAPSPTETGTAPPATPTELDSGSDSVSHLLSSLIFASLTEAAFILLTGFIFGAVLVIELAQRPPTRLYVS
ncbi:hypothetical protein HMN09_00905600 [Mycena chlorophos]|uniref:DUF7587 domain-containing protein n=1 Tax=Mycena chlorophos TaxID=658473 RepID=A0A8H6SPU1_MYCCL|nr:hypothetical protein HMN09_00905600 [Mycena chlorophos]